jgi:hypothetical protein
MKDSMGVHSRICGLPQYGRGQHRVEGPNAAAGAIGMKPLHKHWREAMQRALAAEVGKAQR